MARTYNIVDWQCARRTRQAGLGRLRCTSLFTASNVHAPLLLLPCACMSSSYHASSSHACMHERTSSSRPDPLQLTRCTLFPTCTFALLQSCHIDPTQHRSTNQSTSGAACMRNRVQCHGRPSITSAGTYTVGGTKEINNGACTECRYHQQYPASCTALASDEEGLTQPVVCTLVVSRLPVQRNS